MIPEKGQYVKIIFRNSTYMEGFVEQWSSSKSILKAEDGQSLCIILKTDEDVMAVKIMNTKIFNKSSIQFPTNVEEEFDQVVASPSDDNLRIEKLAKLKQMMIEQEHKIIKDKLKSHTITSVKPQQYGLPDFLKKNK